MSILCCIIIEKDFHLLERIMTNLFSQTISNWNLLIICTDQPLYNKFDDLQLKYNKNKNLFFQKCIHKQSLNHMVRFFLDNSYSHLCLMNNHDKYYPNFLKFLLEKNNHFVYGNYHEKTSGTNPSIIYKKKKDLEENYNYLCNTMWSKDAIQRIGNFDNSNYGVALHNYYVRTFTVLKPEEISYIHIALNTCLCDFFRTITYKKKIKLIINANSLLDVRGIGQYSIHFLTYFQKLYHDEYFIILLCPNKVEEKIRHLKINKIINVDHTTNNIEKIINDEQPAIFLNMSPLALPLNINPILLHKNIKKYSILYDLIPLKMDFRNNAWKNNPHAWNNYSRDLNYLKLYDKLLSISEFTTNDCKNELDNIVTIGTGVLNHDIIYSDKDQKEVLKKFNINKKYIFCQTGPGKNKGISFLYDQYSKLNENIKNDLLLVLGTYHPEVLFSVNQLSQIKKNSNIIITGYLTETDKHILHENAWLFITPSYYEGFGIPPIESMKHNKPVIVSYCTSLIDVIGNKKFSFNHDDSCSKLITNLYNNIELYNECIENSKIQKNKFNWEDVVTNFHNLCIK